MEDDKNHQRHVTQPNEKSWKIDDDNVFWTKQNHQFYLFFLANTSRKNGPMV